MPQDSSYDEVRAILAAAGTRVGVPVHDARLLRSHSNASFALPSAGLVVRIATNPDALNRVAASIAVTRWLAGRGFPCVVPADIDDQPSVEAGRVVSVWRYVPTKPAPPPAGAELGGLLRDLHQQPGPPYPLGRFGDPFASVASAMEEAPEAMSEANRSWLSDRITSLRALWSAMDFPWSSGLIHGDAHIGNLMRAASGEIVLGDWDLEGFTAAYGWDARDWQGLDTLVAVREITGLSPYIRTARAKPFSREQLVHRLSTLQDRDTAARWQSPPED